MSGGLVCVWSFGLERNFVEVIKMINDQREDEWVNRLLVLTLCSRSLINFCKRFGLFFMPQSLRAQHQLV